MQTEKVSSIAISIREITKIFGTDPESFRALDNVSVSIVDNEFFTLLGPSGCGKTTLLRLIAGFEQPTHGEIKLHGQPISHLPPYQRSVNTVFQNYALFPHMTVAQNIRFGLEMQGKAKHEVDDTVAEMLQLVKMEHLASRQTHQISGGQQQRVALARALAPHPQVLLLDEPLSALDYKLRKEMQVELKRLQTQTGITFIFVTHDQEEALTMSDRVAVMNEGKILQVGSPHEIYNHPTERFVADFIGDTNFLNAHVLQNNNREGIFKLSHGAEICVATSEDIQVGQTVTLAVRPEQALLVPGIEKATLQGVLEEIVYFGTDTHYHIKLADNKSFTVRMQNRQEPHKFFERGTTVGIQMESRAFQILRD